MNLRERVYILQTPKAAAMFLQRHPHISSENVMFNTDNPPPREFPTNYRRFGSKEEIDAALAAFEVPTSILRPDLNPRFFHQFPNGRKAIIMNNKGLEDLSQENKTTLVQLRREELAIKTNHERAILQGWFFNETDKMWSIPRFKYNRDAVIIKEHRRKLQEITEKITQDVKRLPKNPKTGFVTTESLPTILTNLELILKKNGANVWGAQCSVEFRLNDLQRLEAESNMLMRRMLELRRSIATTPNELVRQQTLVDIDAINHLYILKRQELTNLQQQRAIPSNIKDIDARLKPLAKKIHLAYIHIHSAEVALGTQLTYAERVQTCSDAFGFDIADFTLDIDDLETMIASYQTPKCGLEPSIEDNTPSEYLAVLQLFSLSILNTDSTFASQLKKIPIDSCLDQLKQLARLERRELLYLGTGPGAFLSRLRHTAQGVLGDFTQALSDSAHEAPDDPFGHLASTGSGLVGEAGGILLGRALEKANDFLRPTYSASYRETPYGGVTRNAPAEVEAVANSMLDRSEVDRGPDLGPDNGGGGGFSRRPAPVGALEAAAQEGPFSMSRLRPALNVTRRALGSVGSAFSSLRSALGSVRPSLVARYAGSNGRVNRSVRANALPVANASAVANPLFLAESSLGSVRPSFAAKYARNVGANNSVRANARPRPRPRPNTKKNKKKRKTPASAQFTANGRKRQRRPGQGNTSGALIGEATLPGRFIGKP